MSADYPVLVPQAESVGALAVIRSLGRAGYPVHAAATEPDALGLRSSFARARVIMPPYDSEAFVPWLRKYLLAQGIRAIVPSEGFVLALGSARAEFLRYFPFVRDERALLASLSKHELLEKLDSAPHLPPTLLLDLASKPVPSLRELGAPLYVKTDGCFSLDGENGTTRRFETTAAAEAYLRTLRFTRAVVQGHVEGVGVAAFFLSVNGEIRAEMMHRRLHEVPWTGGVSSLRETWMNAEVLADAREKLRAAGSPPVAMMEYRWDAATGRFWFMELNARFWGSLHLALHAGVDFPRLLLDAWRGEPVIPPRVRGARCRHLPLELRHVWSKLKDPAAPGRMLALLQLAWDTLDPRVKSDLWFPGDRAVLWHALADFARALRRGDAPRVEPETLREAAGA